MRCFDSTWDARMPLEIEARDPIRFQPSSRGHSWESRVLAGAQKLARTTRSLKKRLCGKRTPGTRRKNELKRVHSGPLKIKSQVFGLHWGESIISFVTVPRIPNHGSSDEHDNHQNNDHGKVVLIKSFCFWKCQAAMTTLNLLVLSRE